MTLHECLIYAREHAHTNVVATLEMEEARLEARISASSLMPSLSLATSGNMSFGRNIDPETNTYDNKKTLSQSFGLQISLPLFDGLVSINNLKSRPSGKAATHRRSRREPRHHLAQCDQSVLQCVLLPGYGDPDGGAAGA